MTTKRFTAGTHRALPPEETLRRARPWFDRFGITRVADITGLDRVGIPVMAAYRPDARSLAVSMGKGVTPDAARASAVMESIELWHAEGPDLPLLWGSADELESDSRIVDWSGLAGAGGRSFDSTVPTAWVASASFVDGAPMLVPFEAVHTDGRLAEPPGSGWFACTSNGLASGNNVVEAQVHGLCEVIERDATSLWRLADHPDATAIDPTTVSDPVGRDLLVRFEEAELAVLLHDATSDIGIATVICTVFEPDRDPTQSVYTSTGMGCHPARAVALSRALTEAAQSRLTLISGARDDMPRSRYDVPPDSAARAAWLAANLDAIERAPRSFGELPDLATDSLEDDLDAIVGALVRGGFHPCWIDLGRPEVGIAVVRAVVPGLEQLNEIAGYEPGARARVALVGQ